MTFIQKIDAMLTHKNISKKDLAEKLNITLQQLSMKIKADKFTEKDMIQIADILNCDLDIVISDRDSNMKF